MLSPSIAKFFPEGCPTWDGQDRLVDGEAKEDAGVGKSWFEGQQASGKKKTFRGSRVTEMRGSVEGPQTGDAATYDQGCCKTLSTNGGSEWTGPLRVSMKGAWKGLELLLPALGSAMLSTVVQSLSSFIVKEAVRFSFTSFNISTFKCLSTKYIWFFILPI